MTGRRRCVCSRRRQWCGDRDATGRAIVWRQPSDPERLATVVHGERAIQACMDIDARPRIAVAVRSRAQLQQRTIQLQRVVVADGAPILEAADAVEVRGRGAPGRLGIRGGLGEAGIVAREKAIQEALGVGQRGGPGEPEFDDEAVLEGAEETLDPTLALGGGGGNPPDAELMQGATNLGGGNGAFELEGPALRDARIAVKQAVAVGVGGDRDAIAADEMAEQEEVTVGVFDGPKDGREDFAGSVVDGRMEDEAGAAVFEPGMMTAVHLDEQPRLRHALSPTAVTRRSAFPGTTEAGGAQQALHGLSGDVDALALGQELGEVLIVHAGIGRAGQGENARPDRFGDAPRGASPAVAVRDGRRTVLPPPGEQSTQVAQR